MVGGTNSKFIHICLSETSNFLESPDGAQQKGMGPKTKCMKKEAIFLKNDDVWRCSSFPEFLLFWGHFLERKLIAPEMVPWLSTKIRGPIWRPEDQFGVIW